MKLLRSKFGPFTVYHRTHKEFNDLLQDIDESKYQPINADKTPFIIDAGAHIGMSMLYFKWCFPEARILCFEPSPETFLILQKNIRMNKLKGVTAIQAALSDKNGSCTLYGRMGWEESDTRGNSISPEWGAWQSKQFCQVKTVKLSSYITETVDFLKLDVEGAEMLVLNDIADKLSLVKQLFVETHITRHSNFSLMDIKSLLTSFEVCHEKTNYLYNYVPDDIKNQAKNLNAQLTIFKAKNIHCYFSQELGEMVENKAHLLPYKLSENQTVVHD
ncbi:MAG: FkbM family methyltransferase [Gammaproteobacteria bacterium]